MQYISVESVSSPKLNPLLPSPASALAAGGDILAGTAAAPAPSPAFSSFFPPPLAPLAGVDLAEEGLTAPVEPSFLAADAASPLEPPFSLGDLLPLGGAAAAALSLSLSSTTRSWSASPFSPPPPPPPPATASSSSFLSFLASGDLFLSLAFSGERDLR